ncbi:MAG TPA: ABC transporter substrate-binding protein [Caulobacteraceae bacterium]|nr:ABC transporter substrate-binding protein [Caulobacteraceae bacterium]
MSFWRGGWAPGLLLAAALAASAPVAAGAAPIRVASLDSCADQFVLALAPRGEIVSLSKRATSTDSYERAAAIGLPERRASLETLLAEHATVAVRYWTPDASLPQALAKRGVRVIQLNEANDFAAVRANVREVAAGLGRGAAGEALIAQMDAKLASANHAWGGRSAAYLTSLGFTAGDGTLVGAVMRAAGLTPEAKGPGYGPLPLESLVLNPPAALVLAFFDQLAGGRQHWAIGDAARVQALSGRPTIAALPAAVLGCPAWFAADGATILASAARKP